MARGPKKHLKRVNAPKHWMLDKLGGAWAPRPSQGPHKLRECLPLIVILRNRLKLALNRREVQMICMNKTVQIDGRIRTDPTFPAGLMDVVTLGAASKCFTNDKSVDRYRVLFDAKGRFKLNKISSEEAKFKLCKVKKVARTQKKIPYIVTHDGRTIRYPDPLIKNNDTVVVSTESGKIIDHIKNELNQLVMITKGKNAGRTGTLVSRERHPGSYDIVTIKDASGVVFATRLRNIFTIGTVTKDGKHQPRISLLKRAGVRPTIQAERSARISGDKN